VPGRSPTFFSQKTYINVYLRRTKVVTAELLEARLHGNRVN